MAFIEENSIYILFGLGFAVILLFILCIILFVKVNREKKRYDFFMGTKRRPSQNLEMKLQKFYEKTQNVEKKYSKLLDMVTDLDKTMKSNVQKVGLIRYNPFDEMGGNLCFALALLDGEDNGVVLNGIHSRTGSFTYAKPIQMGVSIYMLSEEENKAVKMAQEQAYVPVHEKVVKVKFKPIFKRRDKEPIMEEQIELELAVAAQEKELVEKKSSPLGDVTSDEIDLILEDEVMAGKIAAAELLQTMRQMESDEPEEGEMEEQPPVQDAPVFMEKIEEEDTL